MRRQVLGALWLLAIHVSAARAATLTVCASGCNYTTITAAVAAANAGDVIQVGAVTLTEQNIAISKNRTIAGTSASQSIVQARSAPGPITSGAGTSMPTACAGPGKT